MRTAATYIVVHRISAYQEREKLYKDFADNNGPKLIKHYYDEAVQYY